MRLADHSSRGVLPTVVRRWVWSRKTSWMRRPWPSLGCRTTEKKISGYIIQHLKSERWITLQGSTVPNWTIWACTAVWHWVIAFTQNALTFRHRASCILGQAPTMLPAGGRQHRGCIIPQTVTHILVLLKMGKIISRNMLSWLKLAVIVASIWLSMLFISMMHGQANIREWNIFVD